MIKSTRPKIPIKFTYETFVVPICQVQATYKQNENEKK